MTILDFFLNVVVVLIVALFVFTLIVMLGLLLTELGKHVVPKLAYRKYRVIEAAGYYYVERRSDTLGWERLREPSFNESDFMRWRDPQFSSGYPFKTFDDANAAMIREAGHAQASIPKILSEV